MELNGWARSPPNLCCLSECHRLKTCFGINGCRTQLFDVKSGSAEIGKRLACLVHLAPFAPSIVFFFFYYCLLTTDKPYKPGSRSNGAGDCSLVGWHGPSVSSYGLMAQVEVTDFFWLFSRSVEARIHTTSPSAEGKHYVFICWVLFKVIFYFPNGKSTIWGIDSVKIFYFLGTP